MGKIVMLALANIRKGTSQAVSLFVLVVISTLLLMVGLVLIIQFSAFFDERANELNAPHVAIIQSEDITTSEQKKYLAEYPGVTESEEIAVLSGYGDHYLNDAKSTTLMIFERAKTRQTMNPPTLIGESLPLDDDSIYVPYLMKAAGGYELGDDYSVIISGKTRTYTIAGFTEEVMYGALMNSLYRLYLSDAAYEELEEAYPQLSCVLMQVRLSTIEDTLQLEIDYTSEFFFTQELDETSSLYMRTLKIDDAKMARTSIPMVMASLMMAFSLILLIICLVVIRFRIVNSIVESMHDIGALKAIGYTSRQIRASIVVQFVGIALVGSMVGLAAAQGVLPLIAQMLESQTTLIWNPGFDPSLATGTFVTICAAVGATSFIVTRRIKKLDPLVALRNGAEASSFKQGRVPLDTTPGPLSLVLAVKDLLGSKKQAVMVSFIVAFVTFASVAGISIYYNIGAEPDEFIKIIAGELPDAGLVIEDTEETEGVLKRLAKDAEVRKVFGYQDVTLSVDGINASTIIVEDFGLLEGNMLAAGRYPAHDNEVALGNNTARSINKDIGDTIVVTQGGKTKEYLVTGMIQLMNSGGVTMAMTYDALLHVQPDYKFDQIYLYLHDDVNVKDYLTELESKEADIFSSLVNMQEMTEAQFSTYGSLFGILTAVILLVTALVICVVLYMVMKTAILQHRRTFGIQKALGFTTLQLMHQLALKHLPIVLTGVIVGGIAGYLCFNPLFVLITSGFGILKTELPTPLLWTIIMCACMVALAYVISLLIASRIRKISPYALVSE